MLLTNSRSKKYFQPSNNFEKTILYITQENYKFGSKVTQERTRQQRCYPTDTQRRINFDSMSVLRR